jgi:copper chaperone CopZ
MNTSVSRIFKLRLMKRINTITIILFSAILLIAVSCNNKGKKSEKTDADALARIEVSINGMTCTGCEQNIQNNVSKLDGIKTVKAAYTVGKAIIEYNPEIVDTTKIRTAITQSGYSVAAFNYLPMNDSIK